MSPSKGICFHICVPFAMTEMDKLRLLPVSQSDLENPNHSRLHLRHPDTFHLDQDDRSGIEDIYTQGNVRRVLKLDSIDSIVLVRPRDECDGNCKELLSNSRFTQTVDRS